MKRACPLIVAVALCLTGCGESGDTSVAVRFDSSAITRASVKHWMAVLSPAGQTKTLSFLISTAWLKGEATELGRGVSHAQVQRRLQQKIASSYPGGQAEFSAYLKASGQTRADVQLGIERELASAAIEHALAAAQAKVTPAQVAAYYASHRQRFAVSETRTVQITNRKSTAQGEQVRREVAAGKSFASISQRVVMQRPAKLGMGAVDAKDMLELDTLERAIFSAPQGVLSGPVKFRVDYYVFEVRKIAPATYLPLRAVAGAIARQLASERRQANLARFVGAWRARWSARTDCSAGYVVRKCRQYTPPAGAPPESPYTLE